MRRKAVITINKIKIARLNAGLSQKEIAISLKVSSPTVSDWENGKKFPSGKNLVNLAQMLGTTTDYLLGNTESESPASKKGVKIPVLGKVAAGIPIEAITDILDYEEIDPTIARTGEFFGLRIEGRSMEPRMQDGDVVIVRMQETADTGDTVVVLVNGNSATVKKIKYGPDGITLLPTNPSYDPMFFSAAEVEALPVRVIGKVVELRAKY